MRFRIFLSTVTLSFVLLLLSYILLPLAPHLPQCPTTPYTTWALPAAHEPTHSHRAIGSAYKGKPRRAMAATTASGHPPLPPSAKPEVRPPTTFFKRVPPTLSPILVRLVRSHWDGEWHVVTYDWVED